MRLNRKLTKSISALSPTVWGYLLWMPLILSTFRLDAVEVYTYETVLPVDVIMPGRRNVKVYSGEMGWLAL